MKRTLLISSLLCAGVAACGDDTSSNTVDAPTAPVDTPQGGQVIRVGDDITTDTTWEAKNIYVIPRLKQLFVLNGATLTIEPGTEIQGEQGSVLVIARGSKIMAEGTKDAPIVLTSAQPKGQRTAGWWGGLLVLGNAPINVNTPTSTEATYEAFTSAIAEGKFGGTNAADSSGTIKYVRIEFAGFEFIMGREFNNLTLAGVGSGTTVDYVQVHGGSDDGIEFFGGTVNVKHIVSSQNHDDGFDTDNGWVGKAQFIIVQLVAHAATPPSDATNGYEMDNHATAFNNLPRSEPTIYNATLIGDHAYAAPKSFAALIRRGTGAHLVNHLFVGFPLGPEFRDAETRAQLEATNPTLEIKSSWFVGNGADDTNMPPAQTVTTNGTTMPDPNDIAEATFLGTPSAPLNNNKFATAISTIGFAGDVFSKTAPNFALGATAAALTGGATPPAGFFENVTFIGAMGTEDWTAGWTAYPQN